MSTPADNDGRENRKVEPDRKANDEDRISHKSTVKRIEEYSNEVTEFQKLFAQSELTSGVDEAKNHRAYHKHVKGFCQLLKPYLTDDDLPGAVEYWHNVEIGEFEIQPPDVLKQPSQEEMARALRGGHQKTIARSDSRNSADDREYKIEGLRHFMDSPPQWEEEWNVMFGPGVSPADLRSEIDDPTVRVEDQSNPNEPITVVKTARVPRFVIDNAAAEIEKFRREIGMAIEMKKEGLVTDHI